MNRNAQTTASAPLPAHVKAEGVSTRQRKLSLAERTYLWFRSLFRRQGLFFYRGEAKKHQVNAQLQRSADRNYYFRQF